MSTDDFTMSQKIYKINMNLCQRGNKEGIKQGKPKESEIKEWQ